MLSREGEYHDDVALAEGTPNFARRASIDGSLPEPESMDIPVNGDSRLVTHDGWIE